jgi:hypothetical protein
MQPALAKTRVNVPVNSMKSFWLRLYKALRGQAKCMERNEAIAREFYYGRRDERVFFEME